MQLKRFKDIIAVKSGPNDSDVIAYHARNMEVAEVSLEAFNAMADTSLTEAVPYDLPAASRNNTDSEAVQQLQQWQSEENPNVRSGKIDFGIKTLTLNVTQICNLKCSFCAAGGDGTYGEAINKISVEKTLPQMKFFLEQLPSGAKFNLSFVGGEPLLYPDGIRAIYDYVAKEGAARNIRCNFTITTNGTLVTDAVIEMLKNVKTHITVSLDGDKDVNDKARPSKDGRSSTEAALQGLEKLSQIRSQLLSLGVSSVITKENSNVVKNFLFFRQLPVDWFEFNFSVFEKDPETQKKYIDQMGEIAALAWKDGGEKELRRIRSMDTYFDVLDSQKRIENFCGAGKSYLMVDAKNRLYTCPWVVGDKDEIVGVGPQLDQAKLAKYQKPLVELNNCNNCWARFVCGGGCMFIHKTATGDKHTKDKFFCERTRSLILMAILYYKWARA